MNKVKDRGNTVNPVMRERPGPGEEPAREDLRERVYPGDRFMRFGEADGMETILPQPALSAPFISTLTDAHRDQAFRLGVPRM